MLANALIFACLAVAAQGRVWTVDYPTPIVTHSVTHGVTTIETPSVTTIVIPSGAPTNTPIDTPVDTPSHSPSGVPIGTPSGAPIGTPPVHTPVYPPGTTILTSIITPTSTSTSICHGPSGTPSPGVPPVTVEVGPCSPEGLWNCVDGASFQRCASGVWSVVQLMARGTHCVKGKTMDFQVLPDSAPNMIQPAAREESGDGFVQAGPSTVMIGPCEDEGFWNCIDGESFQRCASGTWSVAQPVALGTICLKGRSMDLKVMRKRLSVRDRRRTKFEA